MAISRDENSWKDDDFLSFGAIIAEDVRHVSFGPTECACLPPWMNRPATGVELQSATPLIRLHNEILWFCDLMSPRPEEVKERNKLVQSFEALVQRIFGVNCSEVIVFGSQASGVFIPSSDVDIVIRLSGNHCKEGTQDMEVEINVGEENDERCQTTRVRTPLDLLTTALCDEWHDQLSYLEVVAKARVPLVKFTHSLTGLSVDVSFLQETGPQAAALVRTLMDAMPCLRPLVFVLKYFLAVRVLNQPYSGGVGGFAVQLMLVSFLQHRERKQIEEGNDGEGQYNLGCLLVEFLEVYGTKYNYCTTGLSVRHDGSFFRKGVKRDIFFNPSRHCLLAIENPLDVHADVGQTSFRVPMVQRAFTAAYKSLLPLLASPGSESVLAAIIPPTNELLSRQHR